MSEYLLVIGCAQGRMGDLYHLVDIALNNYGFQTILVCQVGAAVDENKVDQVFYTDLADSERVAQLAGQLQYLNVVTGLIFSDAATRHGPSLLHALNLLDADVDQFIASNDKFKFRNRERELAPFAPCYSYAPGFAEVASVADVERMLLQHPGGLILKPKSEAGSRGVSRVTQASDVKPAFDNALPFLAQGLVVEELLPIAHEYSFDGVGQISFITAKVVALGRFPVEIGQLVPAPLAPELNEKITCIGRWMNRIANPNALAFHNEIGLLTNHDEGTSRLACIESNQRPAGMKIWSLAEKVYGRDLYEYWLECRLGRGLEEVQLTPNGSALTMMLGIEDGWSINHDLHACRIAAEFALACDALSLMLFDFEWLETGTISGRVPRSNAEFAAQACLHSTTPITDIDKCFASVQALWNRVILPYVDRREVA